MMRSLFSGVAGLKNHQTRMDVIGNNIANVNTTGYKAGRATFQDMLSQTLQGAASPTGNIGGINPMQIGLGMGLASVDNIFTRGSFQTTGKNTDLAIGGDGFFILKKGEETYYTKAGNFDFDVNGDYVVPGTGMKVAGWTADANGRIDTSGPLGTINVPVGATMEAKASTSIELANNLSGNDFDPLNPTKYNKSVEVTVYDTLGQGHLANVAFKKVDPASLVTANAPAIATALTNAQVAFANSQTALATAQTNLTTLTAAATKGANDAVAAATAAEALAGSNAASVAAAVNAYLTNLTTQYGANPTDAQKAELDAIAAVDAAAATAAAAGGATANSVTVAATGAVTAATSTNNPTVTTAQNAVTTAQTTYNADKSTLDAAQAAYNAEYAKYTNQWNVEFSVPGTNHDKTNPYTGTISFDKNGQNPTIISGNLTNCTFNLNSGAAATMTITPDFSTLTQYGGETTIAGIGTDGYPAGTLDKSRISVDSTGIITGAFSNGQVMNLGQVALALFSNPAGLTKVGSTLFVVSNNSGEPQVGTPGSGGLSTVTAGTLEMSNVDVSEEFTSMITTQRGFQANSRIITTSDSMLEELVNLKR